MTRQARSFRLILPCLLSAAALSVAGCGGQPQTVNEPAQAAGAPQALYSAGRIGPFTNVAPLELAPGGSLGALGLNLEPLFSENLKTPDERLDRLEATVLAMQADLNTLAPSMQRMAVVEQDLAAAVIELREILNQQKTVQATSQATPKAPAKAAPKPVAKPETKPASPVVKTQSNGVAGAILPESGGITAPAASATASSEAGQSRPAIRALRLGEHGQKTRLVFDVTQKPAYRTDLDNTEKLLVVEIDGAEWAGKIPAALSSPMVRSYAVQKMDNGTRFIVTLKKSARISLEEVLNPEGANGPYRLVVDLTNS